MPHGKKCELQTEVGRVELAVWLQEIRSRICEQHSNPTLPSYPPLPSPGRPKGKLIKLKILAATCINKKCKKKRENEREKGKHKHKQSPVGLASAAAAAAALPSSHILHSAACTTIEMLSLLPFRWPARAAQACVCYAGPTKVCHCHEFHLA